MSHHFDSPTGQEDPRLNLCDIYIFPGSPGHTVMAMTVNADAGISAPDTFRSEGVYAFRFDLNGDAREELTYKVRFGEPTHAAGDIHEHVQSFEVRRAVGADALQGVGGDLIASGTTGQVVRAQNGVKAFAGLAPDMFSANHALVSFIAAFFNEGTFIPDAFVNPQELFLKRNITAIVLEVPTAWIGDGLIRIWGTISLYGHAPEVQVARWGLPLITHMYMVDPQVREDFNRSHPSDDLTRWAPVLADVVKKMTGLAGSSAVAQEYGMQLIERFVPVVLPYRLGTPAAFDFLEFNGRALTDDVTGVMLTLMTNTPLTDGVVPPADRVLDRFPYFGAPFLPADQAGLEPLNPGSKFMPTR
ncbi:MAG: DUF4331 family protein [Candidatus Cybelea sp.]